MAVKKEKKHTSHHQPTIAFIRAGNQLVNLSHVIQVSLPVEGDPKQPLALTLMTGNVLQLVGDDADAVMDALGECCDCEPVEPPKDKAATEKPKKGE